MIYQYAVLLIKPDAVRDVLEKMIIEDILKGQEIKPIFLKYLKLEEEIIPIIYPDWKDKPEFPSMVHNLISGISLFVILQGNSNIFTSLTKIKGKMNQGGLRLKYRTYSIEEWNLSGYSGEKLQHKIAENRLHTTDNLEETVRMCSLLMNCHEVERLNAKAPALASNIKRMFSICK